MHPSQGSKASRLWPLRQRAEEVPDLRDIHQVGWALVPVLRLQAADKAKESEVQGEITFENAFARGHTRTRAETGFAGESDKTKSQNGFEHPCDQF
jgi:hypothetical protein